MMNLNTFKVFTVSRDDSFSHVLGHPQHSDGDIFANPGSSGRGQIHFLCFQPSQPFIILPRFAQFHEVLCLTVSGFHCGFDLYSCKVELRTQESERWWGGKVWREIVRIKGDEVVIEAAPKWEWDLIMNLIPIKIIGCEKLP
jgi:hypothetical protein